MPKTVKPRSETNGGRRRAASGPALASGGRTITQDVAAQARVNSLTEADATSPSSLRRRAAQPEATQSRKPKSRRRSRAA
jgi:hypothetical protein